MPRQLSRRVVGVALLALAGTAALGAGIAVGAASTARAPSTAVTAAHLRITLSTTSDWTQVHVHPGSMVAGRLTRQRGPGRYVPLADGFGLTGGYGTAVAVADLVLSEPSGAARFTLEIDKGAQGRTAVGIDNLDGRTPRRGPRVTDTVSSRTDPLNRRRASVPRVAVMGASPMPQPRADARRLILAFYYPWWGSYRDPRLADRPAQPRSVWSPAGVASMTAQAKAHGINGFIVSWHGDAKDGPAFELALHAAEQQRQLLSAYIETPSATSPASRPHADPLVVEQWVVEAAARGASPAFLKAADGVPVVFVYGMGYLLPQQWARIERDLSRRGLRVHLVGDDTDGTYTPYEWGIHHYTATEPAADLAAWSRATAAASRGEAVLGLAAPRLFAATVSPGFDDRRLRGRSHQVVARGRHAQRYATNWSAALAGAPDWVLVTSWNEWFEDTEVEPGVATGDAALRATARLARAWRTS